MMDASELSGLAEGEIAALQADGIILTPADIVLINALAWNVETPESRRLLSRGIPVFVGGVVLWPLTLTADDWYSRVGSQFGGKKVRTYALAYAMAHGRESGYALSHDGRDAERAVNKWRRKLTCSVRELDTAMSQVIAQSQGYDLPPDESDQNGMTIGEFSASLAAAAGGDVEFWEQRCSSSYAFSVMFAISQQNRADDRPMDGDPRIDAERALGWEIAKIRGRDTDG